MPRKLPPATGRPCPECPWRKGSEAGHLGPHRAEEWLQLARSDDPAACHMTLDGKKGWGSPNVKQCAGLAAFRRNNCKSSRRKDDASNGEIPDEWRQDCFRNGQEFLDHHLE